MEGFIYMISQSPLKPGLYSGALDEYAVPARLVTHVVLPLLQTR